MSCVAAIKFNNKIYMAADSLSTCDDRIKSYKAQKIYRNGDYLIGHVGAAVIGQYLLPRYFEPPDDIDDFVDELQEYLNDLGVITKTEMGLDAFPCELLIGHKGKLYELSTDFHMIESDEIYSAIGNGDDIAVGVLMAFLPDLKKRRVHPEYVLKQAIEAAKKRSVFVGGKVNLQIL